MNFSIFAGDGTLGLDNARVVVLRGTTTVSQLFSPNLFPINDWIKTGLENRGFSVNAVRSEAPYWISGYQINIELELNVYNEYTAEQARQNAVAAIEDYRANNGLNKVFSSTTLDVAYDTPVYATAGIGGGYSNQTVTSVAPHPPQAGSPPSAFNLNSAAPNGPPASNTGPNASSSFWSALGLTAAPSATVLILGAAIIAVIALKK